MLSLVIDFGSASCRALLLGEDGRALAEAREVSALRCDAEGASEVDVDGAFELCARVCAAVLAAAPGARPDGLGLSALLAWVFLDAGGRPLRPAMTWADTRGSREAAELQEEFGREPFQRLCRRPLSPELLLPKLRYLARAEPDNFRRLARILSLKDYLRERLCAPGGELRPPAATASVTDRATAAYTGLLDIASLGWDASLIAAAGLPPAAGESGLLPRVDSACALSGAVAKGAAAGLPPGLPCIVGSVDGTTAMYGSGVLLPGVAAVVSGTTDVLMTAFDGLPSDPSCRLSINPGMVDGLYLAGGATSLACGALDYFCGLLSTSLGAQEEAIAALGFDVDHPIALPGLGGERAPYWLPEARGGLLGLRHGHGPAHVLRAVMESTSFRLAAILECLSDAGARAGAMVISGGGARSAAWNKLRADVCGLPVSRSLQTEATAAGTRLFVESALSGEGLCGLSAARIGLGQTWAPDPSLGSGYRARRQRFERALGATGTGSP